MARVALRPWVCWQQYGGREGGGKEEGRGRSVSLLFLHMCLFCGSPEVLFSFLFVYFSFV